MPIRHSRPKIQGRGLCSEQTEVARPATDQAVLNDRLGATCIHRHCAPIAPFEAVWILNWKSLNLAHEVLIGTAARRHQDWHDFGKSSRASGSVLRASSIKLRVRFYQPNSYLLPRLEGREGCVIQCQQSLTVRASKFTAYWHRIKHWPRSNRCALNSSDVSALNFVTCSHATFGDISCPTLIADSLIGTHLGLAAAFSLMLTNYCQGQLCSERQHPNKTLRKTAMHRNGDV